MTSDGLPARTQRANTPAYRYRLRHARGHPYGTVALRTRVRAQKRIYIRQLC